MRYARRNVEAFTGAYRVNTTVDFKCSYAVKYVKELLSSVVKMTNFR